MTPAEQIAKAIPGVRYGSIKGGQHTEVLIKLTMDTPPDYDINPTHLAWRLRRLAEELDAVYHYEMGRRFGSPYDPATEQEAAPANI